MCPVVVVNVEEGPVACEGRYYVCKGCIDDFRGASDFYAEEGGDVKDDASAIARVPYVFVFRQNSSCAIGDSFCIDPLPTDEGTDLVGGEDEEDSADAVFKGTLAMFENSGECISDGSGSTDDLDDDLAVEAPRVVDYDDAVAI